MPIGWAIVGANRNDIRLLEPTLAAVAAAGLLQDIGTLVVILGSCPVLGG